MESNFFHGYLASTEFQFPGSYLLTFVSRFFCADLRAGQGDMRIEDAGIGRRKDSEGRGAGIEICRDSEAQDSSARLETCREGRIKDVGSAGELKRAEMKVPEKNESIVLKNQCRKCEIM